MTENQIQQLIRHGKLPSNQKCQELKQTHISWLILCQDFVYKIKKPIALSFLNFSTLAKRKHFCEQELILNQRLTTDMYLRVDRITLDHGVYCIGLGAGRTVDYSVVMRRVDNSKEMSKLLPVGGVRKSDIRKIATQLINFHQKTEIIKGKLTSEVLIKDFTDIQCINTIIKDHLGLSIWDQLSNIISSIERFIHDNSLLISKRDAEGFTRDCHGDLHSGNIFLLDNPVLFDCIEFNNHFRQIDILNELAFFCMDLEFSRRPDLSEYFMRTYIKAYPVIRSESEEQLFIFYKLYRANVKAKVNAIKVMQAHDPEERGYRLDLFKKYLELLFEYFRLLKGPSNPNHRFGVPPVTFQK